MRVSRRAEQIAPSATLAVGSRAAEMRRGGVDVVSFGQGEPDFDTPEPVRNRAKQALDEGWTRYAQPSVGLPAAREAACEKLRRHGGLRYQPDQVLMTCGAKEAVYLALAAIINPGDEVLLPVPYWVSFPEQIALCGGVTVRIGGDESNDFKIRPAELAAAIMPATRALIFNSPSNPGGFTYSRDEVAALAAVLRDRDVLVIADEIYDRLTYGGAEFASFAAAGPEWPQRTLIVNATSKSHAMTGWRVGYVAGPKPWVDAMARIQSHTTSGPCTFNQLAVARALTEADDAVEPMRAEFERRARHLHARLTRLRDVTCVRPTGAFYCFPNVSRTYARLGVSDSVTFAERVLTDAHVALVPGAAFGSDAHVRLSFACAVDVIDKGLDRLERLLGRA